MMNFGDAFSGESSSPPEQGMDPSRSLLSPQVNFLPHDEDEDVFASSFGEEAPSTMGIGGVPPAVTPPLLAPMGADCFMNVAAEPSNDSESEGVSVSSFDGPSSVATDEQLPLLFKSEILSNVSALCPRCIVRLREMHSSTSAPIRKAAALWEENWSHCGKKCFGVCDSEEFCVSHGFPLAVCRQRHPGEKHMICVYKGKWIGVKGFISEKPIQHEDREQVMYSDVIPRELAVACKRQRVNMDAVSDSSSFASPTDNSLRGTSPESESHSSAAYAAASMANFATTTTTTTSTAAATAATTNVPEESVVHLQSSVWPCECAERLRRLLDVSWIKSSPEFVEKIRKQYEESQTRCLGFCQTSYLCRIHACPATFSESHHPSRYQCQAGSHEGIVKKGRHHAYFCYYCADPECCNGKWYSRDETHTRTLKRRQKPATDLMFMEEARGRTELRRYNNQEMAMAPRDECNNTENNCVDESPFVPDSDDSSLLGNDTPKFSVNDSYEPSAPELIESNLCINVSNRESVYVPHGLSAMLGRAPWRFCTRPHLRNLAMFSLGVVTCVLLIVTIVLGSRIGNQGGQTEGSNSMTDVGLFQMCWSMQRDSSHGKSNVVDGCAYCDKFEQTPYLRCTSGVSFSVVLNLTMTMPKRGHVDKIFVEDSTGKAIAVNNVVAPWSFTSSSAVPKDSLPPPFYVRDKGEKIRSVTGGDSVAWFGFLVPPSSSS